MLGEFGWGEIPLGADFYFEPTTALAECPTFIFTLMPVASPARGMALLPVDSFEYEAFSSAVAGLGVLPVSSYELSFTAPTLQGMAVHPHDSFVYTDLAIIGAATVPMPTAKFWLTPYVSTGATAANSTVVVFNANTLAVTEYSIAPLDVVEHEGEVYFVTETGLTKLAAPADADEGDVVSYIQTGDMTLMDGHRINLWRTHLDLSADAPMRLTTRLKMAGQERDIAYTVPERSSAQSRGRMVELARGPRGERWAIKIGTTEAGGNWALDSLAVVPGAIKRGR